MTDFSFYCLLSSLCTPPPPVIHPLSHPSIQPIIHPSIRHSQPSVSSASHFLSSFLSPGTQWPLLSLPNILLHLLLPPWPGATLPTILLQRHLSGPSASRWTRTTRTTSWVCFRGGWAASSPWWCPSLRRAPACRCRRRCSLQSNGGDRVPVETPQRDRPAGIRWRRWRGAA